MIIINFRVPIVLFSHRSLKVIAILIACVLIVLGSISMLALVQELYSFEINEK